MSILWSIITYPFKAAIWALWITLKFIGFIFLLCTPPFGWYFLAGYWGGKKIRENQDTNNAILAELQRLRAEKNK